MYIKKLLITTVLGVSMLGANAVSADQTSTFANSSTKQASKHHGFNRMLTTEQRKELHNIMKGLHEQLVPLFKEKMALKMQVRGKLATPQTQWADISKLVDQINENNAKITTLITRTQLTTFQKLGVLLPLPHHRFHGHKHGFKFGRG